MWMKTESELYSSYRVKDLADRTIDQLVGMAQMAVADGKVTTEEAKVLHRFLQRASLHPTQITDTLLARLSDFFIDGVLDDDEAIELLELLRGISGGELADGELAKSSSLPLCKPAPEVIILDRTFCFTGTFAYGSRDVCKKVISQYGGYCERSGITFNTDYLVIGSYVTDSWKHETFGRKIEKAMDYRDRKGHLQIVSEDTWLRALRTLGNAEAEDTKLPGEAVGL